MSLQNNVLIDDSDILGILISTGLFLMVESARIAIDIRESWGERTRVGKITYPIEVVLADLNALGMTVFVICWLPVMVLVIISIELAASAWRKFAYKQTGGGGVE